MAPSRSISVWMDGIRELCGAMVNRNRKSSHYGAIAFDFSPGGLDIKTHPKFSFARFILPSLREGGQAGELVIFAAVK